MKKFIGIILTLSILFSLSSEVLAFDISKVDATLESVGNYLYETVKEPQVGSIGGEWAVLGLARSTFPQNLYHERAKQLDRVQYQQRSKLPKFSLSHLHRA